MDSAHAGTWHEARHGGVRAAHRTPTPGRGGYSLMLREVRVPAIMPTPPQDFRSDFHFPPETFKRRTESRSICQLDARGLVAHRGAGRRPDPRHLLIIYPS